VRSQSIKYLQVDELLKAPIKAPIFCVVPKTF